MTRGITPSQASYPIPADFAALIQGWRSDALDVLLEYVWCGFDTLLVECEFDFAQANENIERDISQLVCQRIRDAMEGKPPFYLEHHPFEVETREPAPAAPPAPDLAFILRRNPRASFPMEAKVIPTDGAVTKYCREVTDNFLECRYAPFSSQGGMLGYLLKGRPSRTFEKIAEELGCELTQHPSFRDRNHQFSEHDRTSANCQNSPREFTCHHMIILF